MRKSFTRLFGFLLLSVMMLYSYGLYAQEAQSTVELKAGSVNACYNASDSYTAKISVKDFIAIKSFIIKLKFDPLKFQYKGTNILDSQLSPLYAINYDNVNGTLEYWWTGSATTIGDDALTDILGVQFGVTGFPNNSGTNVFASAFTVTSAQFWYAPTGGGSDEIRTTSITNGTLTATVAYPTVTYTTAPATCDGGQANITVTSPVGAGFFYYFNGSTTSSTVPVATAQAPSTNYVRVVDSNGCSSHLTTIPVTAPTPLVINSVTSEPAKCYGGNGEIQISAAGGTGPYTYYVVPYNNNNDELWYFQQELYYGDGKNSPELDKYRYTNFQILKPAGTYWVTVDGANGCNTLIHPWWWGISSNTANPAWQLVTVGQPSSPVAFGTSVTGNSCYGATEGVITVSNPNGGSGEGYQVTKDGGLHWYNFLDSEGLYYTFDGLAAGTYTITVKDDNGCSTSSVLTVTQPNAIAFTLAYGDATCSGGATGSITITSVSGGTAPYTYAVALTTAGVDGATWSSTSVQTLGLTANYYSVWVKDANGCTKAFANQDGSGNILPIQAPGALAFSTSADNAAALEVKCNGGSYTLTVTATGGVKPYSYSFNGGATTTSTTYALAGLLADTPVTVTVTDANSCSVSKLVNIDVADAMVASVASDPSVISPTCPGGNDGRVTVLASGGTAPYTYYTDALLKVPFTNNVLAIPEGLTTITVVDTNNCSAQTSVSVDYLTASTLTATVTNIDCHGSKTGKIDVVTTWQAGRTVKFYVSANQADVFTAGTLFNPTTINTVANTSTPTTFVAGTYYLGAKDEMGCTSNVVKVVITEKAALAMTAVSTPATCSGLFDGTLTINTTGGFGHPQYAIANNIEAFSSSSIVFQPVGTWSATTSIGKQVIQVQRGTYYVKIKDDCTGSTVAGPFMVDGYKPITFTGTIAKTNITCHDSNNGTITVPLAGVKGGKPEFDGAGNYIFTLIKPTGTATNTTGAFTGLAEGTYTVTITDVTNCPLYTSSAITISNPAVVAISSVAVSHFTCKSSRDGQIAVTATGGTPGYYLAVNASADKTGTDIKASDWIAFGTSTTTTTKTYIATEPGVYYLYIKDANGCLGGTVSVTVSEPAVLVPVVGTVTNVTCTSAGSAQINVTGGWGATMTPTVPTYSYVLTGTSTGTNTTGLFSGLAVGNYTVNVQATNAPSSVVSGIVTYTYPVSGSACKYPVSFSITGPIPYTYKANVQNVKCKGGNDGSLTVTVLTGTAATVTTTGPEYYVQLTTTANPTLSTTGWVRTTNQKYTFANLTHAIYSVWIGNKVDGSDCVIAAGTSTPTADGVFNRSASWEVNEPATALTASAVWVKDVTCYGGSDGKFTITAAGGTASYTYASLPSFVESGHVRVPDATEFQMSNAFEKAIGTYVIWVKDANGCVVGGEGTIENPIDEYRVQLRQPLQVAFSTSITNATCYGVADGKITVSNITSAGAPFTWTVTGVDYAGNAVNMSSTTTATTSFVINNVPASETVGSTTTKTYSVTLTDKNGCSRTLALAGPIYQNKQLTVNIAKADGAFVCPGDNNGTIEAIAAGGTGSYTYRLWKDGSAYTAWVSIPSFLVQVGHTWAVEVKDENGCTATDEEVINAPVGVTAVLKETTCYADAKASVVVSATGEAGRTFSVRYRINTGTYGAWLPLNANNELAIGDLLFANVTETENFYYFQVKDNKGCMTEEIKKPFVPTQHPLQVTASVADLNATVVITGGISPYSYKVGTATVTLATDGDTFQVVNLPAGQNTITVFDAHGCSFPVVANVAPLTVTAEPATGNAMKNSFDVELTFNREVTGVVSATTVAGGTISSVTGTGKVYTVTVVGADLATVTLTVGSAVKDAAGSTLSPSAVFTYVVGDNTAPKLVSWTPNNVTLTDNHPTFVLTFDENIAVGSGNIKVYKKSGDALALTVPVTGAAVSGKTATVTYVYDSTKGGLDKNTDYYVLLDAGAFKDVAGNASGAVATSTAWTFKTGDFATVVVDPNASVFKVYPNPFVDYVTVTNASELSKVVVSNIAGQVVKEVVYPDGTIQLNELRSGVYFITLYQDNEVVSTVKLLKR